MSEQRPTLINPSAYVPLTVVVSAIAITIMVMSKLNTIENAIADLQARSQDRWTATNMETWIDKTVRRNPNLNLPSAGEVREMRMSP
jgi:hypothetical protein